MYVRFPIFQSLKFIMFLFSSLVYQTIAAIVIATVYGMEISSSDFN